MPAAGPPPPGPLPAATTERHVQGSLPPPGPSPLSAARVSSGILGWPFTRGRHALPVRAARPRRQSHARGPRAPAEFQFLSWGPGTCILNVLLQGILGSLILDPVLSTKSRFSPRHRRGPLASFPQSLCVQIRAQFLLGNRAIME